MISKIALVVGTRPEIIKMAPVIRECEQRNIPFVLIHSNQHYSPEMDAIFFEELNLPRPHYNLGVGSGGHANQTGSILIKIEPVLEKEKPDILFVQGDTNTVLAAALAGSKLGIKIGHIEAGLRSYDRTMPEETNRVTTDHLSDFLFAVGKNQEKILHNEGVEREKVHIVGNTITDALFQNIELAESKGTALKKLGLKKDEYFLITAHRSANVDYEGPLTELLNSIHTVTQKYDKKAIWPIHPRTLKKIEEFGLKKPENVITTGPLGYLDFLQLEKNAFMILTDSGGVQEEACILKVPCVTLRENTERPETVEVGGNIIVGRSESKIIDAIEYFKNRNNDWDNPFGDGTSAKKIISISLGEATPLTGKKKTQTISVIGMGYMGLPTASLFACAGYPVTGIDLVQAKVDSINRGECPFSEPGMPELVKRAVHEFNMQAKTQVETSDVYIIAVPTPERGGKCDLSYVIKAAESLVSVLKDGDLVILESTVRPGTCRDVLAPLFEKAKKKVLIAHCPERAIPGNTLNEILHNDRIIGGLTEEATLKCRELYQDFSEGELLLTTATTAEMVKLMENTFRDVNIALANELSEIAEELDVDIWSAIDLANRHPRVNVLYPGPGVGGHCIAVDPHFLIENSKKAKLIPTAREINANRPNVIVEKAEKIIKDQGLQNIAVLGVAYKKNVDDCRETPALYIYEGLKELNVNVKAHDNFVESWDYPLEKSLDDLLKWAELIVLVTDHDEYKSIQFKGPIVDTRHCLV